MNNNYLRHNEEELKKLMSAENWGAKEVEGIDWELIGVSLLALVAIIVLISQILI